MEQPESYHPSLSVSPDGGGQGTHPTRGLLSREESRGTRHPPGGQRITTARTLPGNRAQSGILPSLWCCLKAAQPMRGAPLPARLLYPCWPAASAVRRPAVPFCVPPRTWISAAAAAGCLIHAAHLGPSSPAASSLWAGLLGEVWPRWVSPLHGWAGSAGSFLARGGGILTLSPDPPWSCLLQGAGTGCEFGGGKWWWLQELPTSSEIKAEGTQVMGLGTCHCPSTLRSARGHCWPPATLRFTRWCAAKRSKMKRTPQTAKTAYPLDRLTSPADRSSVIAIDAVGASAVAPLALSWRAPRFLSVYIANFWWSMVCFLVLRGIMRGFQHEDARPANTT